MGKLKLGWMMTGLLFFIVFGTMNVISVRAAETREMVFTEKETTQEVQAEGIAYENDCNISVSNKSPYSAQVSLQLEYTLLEDNKSIRKPVFAKGDSSSVVRITEETNAKITMKPGETVPIKVIVEKETGKKSNQYQIKVTGNIAYQKSYTNISCDAARPSSYTMGTKVCGPLYLDNGEYAKQYYTFTLNDAATVSGTYNAETGWMDIEQGTGYRERIYPGSNISLQMPAGTYSVCVYTALSNGSKYYGKEYAFCFNASYHNWGNVKVNWNIKNLTAPCDIPFEVTLSGTTATKLDKTSAMTWKGSLHNSTPGYYTFSIPLNGGKFGIKTLQYSYVVRPGKENLSKSRIKTTAKSISIINTTNYNNTLVKVQMLEGGKWVTKATKFDSGTGVTTLSGLKADKKYTIRLVNCYDNKKNAAVYGEPSKAVAVYTASKKKPVVKSIKIYGFKKFYNKKKWYPGYWNTLNKWVSGHYQGGYYSMSYKIKVTLKGKIKGKGIRYIYINGIKCKVKKKGKSYVVTDSYRGTSKKKKLFVYVCTAKDASYGGFSPSTKKYVKIK